MAVVVESNGELDRVQPLLGHRVGCTDLESADVDQVEGLPASNTAVDKLDAVPGPQPDSGQCSAPRLVGIADWESRDPDLQVLRGIVGAAEPAQVRHWACWGLD